MSVSNPLVFALICETIGPQTATPRQVEEAVRVNIQPRAARLKRSGC